VKNLFRGLRRYFSGSECTRDGEVRFMITGGHLREDLGMTNGLRDKVAVVTGGTRGIGYSIAQALLGGGASVFICGRDGKLLKSAIEQLGRSHAPERVDGTTADVSRYQDCARLIQGAAQRFGGLDILVNNAGIGVFRPVDQISPQEWDTIIGTNISGVFYCCREAIPLMRQRGGGYIFNISSLAGVNPFAGGTAYNASKFGLNGFSEAMMQDVRHDKIRVSYIMPGSVATEFGGPSGGQAGGGENWKLTGEDIAKAVVDLYNFPTRALASRIEMRPSRPPKK
jgi:3-oxoacyl-[acyl-carrier protein] reductase